MKNIIIGKVKATNSLLLVAVVLFSFMQKASSQSLSEILSNNETDEASQDEQNDKNEVKLPSDSRPQNIRSAYESKFAFGIMGGANYNFLDNDCYNITPGTKKCIVGRREGSLRWNPREQQLGEEGLQVLKTRGLGFVGRAFVDWDVNQTLGLRLTGGVERFLVKDASNRQETYVNENAITFSCEEESLGGGNIVENTYGGGVTPCGAIIDYATIEALLRYKMNSYDDLTYWIGVGIVGLMPVRSVNNILDEPLPPRMGFKAAVGLDVNLTDTRLFFPLAFDYTWLYKEANNEVRDQMISLTAGLGYRF